MLLYSPDQQFLQVLEGEADVVRSQYYQHIAHNPRPYDCYVLAEGLWLYRSFPYLQINLLAVKHLDVPTLSDLAVISRLAQALPRWPGSTPG